MIGDLCWFCYWGWPKPVWDIYDRARRDIEEALLDVPCEANNWTYPDEPSNGEHALQFGPAHCVWSDENFDSVQWVLKYCDDPQFANWHPPVLEIVRRSLRELDALPPELKEPPKDYDGEHPENYPPPPGWEMVKK